MYYTTRPNLPTSAWNTQPVDNNQLTTISDLTPQTIYTIRIQAFTSRGPGPHSAPVQVKTQQGGMWLLLFILFFIGSFRKKSVHCYF